MEFAKCSLSLEGRGLGCGEGILNKNAMV